MKLFCQFEHLLDVQGSLWKAKLIIMNEGRVKTIVRDTIRLLKLEAY